MSALRLILAVFLLASCARHAPPSVTSTSSAQHLVAVKQVGSLAAAISEIQSGGIVTCASPDACPASVGMLLAADAAGGLDPDSDSVLGCTAVLVGEDIALTNAHCIPAAVKLLPDLCASRVRFNLPAAEGHAGESFACKALLGFSPRETAISPDLALFRLERKTGRAGIALDRSGVDLAAPLRSYRVTPDLRNRTGSLTAASCAPAPGSYRMPVYKAVSDPVFVTGDCDLVPGNSGSPVLDSSGKLRGLLQADLPIPADALAQWLPRLSPPDRSFASLAMGTNLACLSSDPIAGAWSWNPSCTTIEDDDVLAARPRLHDLLGTALFLNTALLAPYEAQSTDLVWAATPVSLSALNGTATLAPACAKQALPEAVSLRVPTYSASVRFNRYLQLVTPFEVLNSEAVVSLAPNALPSCNL